MNYLKKIGKNQIQFIGFSHFLNVIYVKKTVVSHSIILKTDNRYFYDYAIEINEKQITYDANFYEDISNLNLFDAQFLYLEDVKSYICTFSKIKSHSD